MMKENQDLLMLVLKEHFRDRQKIVDEALHEIKQYCKKPNQREYEKTLNKLYDLMNNDLPSNILLYFLTMVPLPEQDDSQSNVTELMKKTHDSLPINIRPILVDYLKSKFPHLNDENLSKLNFEIEPLKSDETQEGNLENNTCQDSNGDSPKKLTDICAEFIMAHNEDISDVYTAKNNEAWKMINSEPPTEKLTQCYEVLKDLNKKRKLLRMIEDDDVSLEIFQDEYQNSEIFLKRHRRDDEDPLQFSHKMVEAIAKFIKKC